MLRNGAAAATFLVYSSGAFTVGLGRLVLKEKIGGRKFLAVAASLAGSALVAGVAGWPPVVTASALPSATGASTAATSAGAAATGGALGLALGLASGLAYAIYSLVGREAGRRGLDPAGSTAWYFGLAALVLLAARLLPEAILPDALVGRGGLFLGMPALLDGGSAGRDLGAAGAWLLLLALGAGPTALGFGLYGASLAKLPAGTANLLVSSEPIFAALAAYLLLGERLGPGAMAGAGLVLAAILLLTLPGRGAGAAEAAPSPTSPAPGP